MPISLPHAHETALAGFVEKFPGFYVLEDGAKDLWIELNAPDSFDLSGNSTWCVYRLSDNDIVADGTTQKLEYSAVIAKAALNAYTAN
jgi:hypothetical protein